MIELQLKFENAEVKPEAGQWAVYVGRDRFGIYQSLAVAIQTAKAFNGRLLD